MLRSRQTQTSPANRASPAHVIRPLNKWNDSLSSAIRSKGCKIEKVVRRRSQLFPVTESDENLFERPPQIINCLVLALKAVRLIICAVQGM